MLPRGRFFLSLFKRGFHNAEHNIQIGGKPLGSTFFHPKVQFFMEKMVTVDYETVFRSKGMGMPLKTGQMTFMTDEELQEAMGKYKAKAALRLQPPPIIDVNEGEIEILSNDKSLDGHEVHHSKVVFTDLSLDIEYHERNIVVREPNGVLRTASWEERHRMNQIFFPVSGRETSMPKMFEPEQLEKVLDRKDYEFVLDRACLQFEPNEKTFHRVLIATYERVNAEKDFEKLCKTRHFGSLAFYLAACRKINGMLLFFINAGKLMEASHLIQLLRVIHSGATAPRDEVPHEVENELSLEDACKIIREYISDPSNEATDFDSALDSALGKLKEQESLESGILKAHGV